MKLPKIKNKKLIKRTLTWGIFFAVGFVTHAYLNPMPMAPQMGPMTPSVSVQEVNRQDLTEKKKFIAEVEAINSVNIIPQVSGYLEEVRFHDGSFVQEGDTLFVIEQSKFKANVESAEADLEKAKSDLVQISSDYDRQLQLYKEKITPKAELEVAENRLNQAKSTIKQAEANLTLAQINLGYTEIKAPISGYIGKVLVTRGNYVSPSVQSLARIVQTDPIRIAFSVSDKERLTFVKDIHGENNTRFEIVHPNGETVEIEAENFFTNNEINPDTATLPVYLDYKNQDNTLIPGNYVDILVSAGKEEKSLVIPEVAIIRDINGAYVMTVDKENKVHQTYIELGKAHGNIREVLKGLNDDDVVIVQGLQKVQDGATVKPVLVTK